MIYDVWFMIYEFSTPPCHSEERSDEDELLRTLSEKSRVHPLIRLRCVTEILQSSVVQSTELPSLSTDRHLVYPLKASFAPSREGRISILYHQVKERREKRNSRNHLFRDYGSKGRGREAHPEFLVVWVVQTCWGVVKTFFEVVFSSDINTTFTTRSCHRKGTFLCLQR